MRGLNHQAALALDAPAERIKGNFEPPALGVVLPGHDQVIVHLQDFMDTPQNFSLYVHKSADRVGLPCGKEPPFQTLLKPLGPRRVTDGYLSRR